MFCVKCGKELPENGSFCPSCGARIGQEPPAQPETPVPPVQAAPVQPGTPAPPVQAVPVQPATPAPPVQAAPVQPETPAPPVQAVPPSPPVPPVQPVPPAPEGGRKNTGLIVGIIVAVLVALAAIAVAVYFILQGRGGDKKAELPSPTPPVVTSQPTAPPPTEEPPEVTPVPLEERAPVSLQIRQVDNSAFPEVTFYSSVLDAENNVVSGLGLADFILTELVSGQPVRQDLREVTRVAGEEKCSVSLVLDASGSMEYDGKMTAAKSAAKSFLSQVNFSAGDQVEIVSFGDYVYLEQDFSSSLDTLTRAIDSITLNNMTALYDALYSALVQTYAQEGARCVIAFTDGMENNSSYTFQDVAELSQSAGIPVYLVGIGAQGDYDEASLRDLAHQCSGEFYAAENSQVATVLAEIYTSIYRQQQEYYIFRYTAQNQDKEQADRTLELSLSEFTPYVGSASRDYQTVTVINGDFGADFRGRDFMLPDSNQRLISESDLAGMSLAQLRIARNEIYARHGRQFKDSMLNQWFYSKDWYLAIHPKYAPASFDAISGSVMSPTELENISTISKYEKAIMESQDIYPNAAAVELTQYDLGLSKAVLQKALDQMSHYRETDTLRKNMELVRQAIDREVIQY